MKALEVYINNQQAGDFKEGREEELRRDGGDISLNPLISVNVWLIEPLNITK